jgi:hypothetical protein
MPISEFVSRLRSGEQTNPYSFARDFSQGIATCLSDTPESKEQGALPKKARLWKFPKHNFLCFFKNFFQLTVFSQ